MSTSTNKKTLIQWAIVIALTLVCFLIPESEVITSTVKIFLAITVFCLALAAFEVVPVLMVAVLLPALYIFLNVQPAAVVLSAWTTTTPLMIVGALVMAANLESSGLLRRVAYYLMAKVQGDYKKLYFAIFLVTVILSLLTSGRGYLIMAPVAAGLCMSLGAMQTKLGAGLCAAVMVGGCTSHIYTYQASIWGVILSMGKDYLSATAITPLSLLLHNWPMFFVSIIIMIIAVKMFKPDHEIGTVTYFDE